MMFSAFDEPRASHYTPLNAIDADSQLADAGFMLIIDSPIRHTPAAAACRHAATPLRYMVMMF